MGFSQEHDMVCTLLDFCKQRNPGACCVDWCQDCWQALQPPVLCPSHCHAQYIHKPLTTFNQAFFYIFTNTVLIIYPKSPHFFHLTMMEATVFLGTFNAAEMFWYPSLDLFLDTILSQGAMDNSFDLMAWFLLWYALSTVGPCIDRCVPFQIMYNQLNLPHVESKL